MNSKSLAVTRAATALALSWLLVELCPAQELNIALNPTGEGFPHPLESDDGWGGGAKKWEIVDGLQIYDHWAHGLAFTGGSAPWVEPAGPRQITINFGRPETFGKVVIWHHTGASNPEHLPERVGIQYWDGASWHDIVFNRSYDLEYPTPRGFNVAIPDRLAFPPVTGTKVRYLIDNRENDIWGRQLQHGWVYEFEVFSSASNSVFLRGDCNDDGDVNISDPVCILNWLFGGNAAVGCVAALNTNGDAGVNITDPVSLLSFLFAGGSAPVAPFPDCGPGTLPADAQLGCANPPAC